MNSNNIQFHTINEYVYNWLLDQITWNMQWHACSQCQSGDYHQLCCNRLKRLQHRNENSPTQGPGTKLSNVIDFTYGANLTQWWGTVRNVLVELLWMYSVGAWFGLGQRSIVSLMPRCWFCWGWGMTGVRSMANWGGWYQGCQRGCRTGLAPWCAIRELSPRSLDWVVT